MTVRTLPASIALGPVTLRVADVELARLFYHELLGYDLLQQDDGLLAAVPPGGTVPHFLLDVVPDAPPRSEWAPGLYHAAVLLPQRADLARFLRHLVDRRWPVAGAADHGVSEAIYLTDPEGNGLEFASDRPPECWPRGSGEPIRMVTRPLDVRDVLRELGASPSPWRHIPAEARIGHVHLQVSNLERAQRFYV
ncbi:MAG: VOC family protein, partial [Thermomicrobium sp.]|nr:VOC family protein [Thermomicrobium sp.]